MTRFEGKCKRPDAYKYKSVATIIKESKDIVQRASERKAIAYGLYGKKRIYLEGILANIKMAQKYLSSWDVVVYVDEESVPKEYIDEMKALGAKVKLGKYAHMFARFYIADAPEYDRFIVRDSDSRFYPREIAAIADWMDTDWAILHGMRDAASAEMPLQGGMWGAISKPLREKLKAKWKTEKMEDLAKEYMGDRKMVWNDDQIFLAKYVVEAVGFDHFLSHETIHCDEYPGSRGFPIPKGPSDIHIGTRVQPD